MLGYRVLKKGETLYSEGESADVIFIIEDGTVDLQTKTGNFNYEKGDILGMFDCCIGRPYSATAVGKDEAQLKMISKQEQVNKLDGTLTYKVLQAFMKNADAAAPGRWS